MRKHKNLNLDDLEASAGLYAVTGDFQRSYLAWKNLYEKRPSLENMVMTYETARILGLETVLNKLSKSLDIASILKVLGEDFADHALIDLMRRKKGLSNNDSVEIQRLMKEGSEDLLRAIVARSMNDNLEVALGQSDLSLESYRSIRTISCNKTILSKSRFYRLSRRISVGFSFSNFIPGLHFTRVRSIEILHPKEIEVYSQSDLVKYENLYFVDRIDYKNSKFLSLQNDSRIFATNFRGELVVRKPKEGKDLLRTLWAAYPATENWGHFFIEVLLRLAIACEAGAEFESISISDLVPDVFIDFIRFLAPSIEIIKVNGHSRYRLIDSFVIPSSVMLPYRFYCFPKGTNLLLIDPRAGKSFDALVQNSLSYIEENRFKNKPRFFLSRQNAKYRLTPQAAEIEDLASTSGYEVVDPGSLSVADEISLFINARHLVGYAGSGWLLSLVSHHLESAVIIGHDSILDSVASTALRKVNKGRYKYFKFSTKLGERSFSEPIVHQNPSMSQRDLVRLQKYLRGKA